MNILIIEDDAAIRQELKLLLENALYQVTVLTEFHHVVEDILQMEPDLLLLDVNLPQQSGFEICKSVRKTSDVPIIFLTSRTDSMDELSGMLQGGDAYIMKPFQPPLLLAHIAAVLKRAKKADVPEKMTCKGVELDVVRGCVKYQEQQVDMPKNELKILHYLFLHQGEIVPRIELVEYLWDHTGVLRCDTGRMAFPSVFSRRSYFRKLEQLTDQLDRRYLLGELMPESFRLEDQKYRELIRKSNKSVIERIHQMEQNQKDYREYIESWVHEIKAPITAIALNCENNRDERSRYLLVENRKVENYVDMALYYARMDAVYSDKIWIAFILNQLIQNSVKYGRICGRKGNSIQSGQLPC